MAEQPAHQLALELVPGYSILQTFMFYHTP